MSSPSWVARIVTRKVATRRRPSFRPFVEGFEERILMSGSPVDAPAQVQVNGQGVSFDAHDAFHNAVNGQNKDTLDRSLTPFITVDVSKVVGSSQPRSENISGPALGAQLRPRFWKMLY